MRVLGIDPALNNTGWAVLENGSDDCNSVLYIGHTKNRNDLNYYDKLANLLNDLENIILIYKPNVIAIEETFMNVNAVSSLKLGVVRGVFFASAIKHNIKICEFKPNEIKKAITGNGKADKQQVDYMVKMLIPKAEPKTPDESDALAIALTYFFSKER